MCDMGLPCGDPNCGWKPQPEPPKNPNVTLDLIRVRASVLHNELVPEIFTPEEMRFVLHLLDRKI